MSDNSAENTFRKAVGGWIDKKTWSGADASKKVIYNIESTDPPNGIIKFQSAFTAYLEVHATFKKPNNVLENLLFALVVPGWNRPVPLVVRQSYSLPEATFGEVITFRIARYTDVIYGKVAFRYVTEGNPERKRIAVKYDVTAPFVGRLDEPSYTISPTEGDDVPQQYDCEDIPAYVAEEDSLFVTYSSAEEEVLLNYLAEFVDGDKVIIPSYNPVTSKEYEVSVGFLGIFELVGSISPTTLTIAAALFVRVPIAGRVRLVGIQGSLTGPNGLRVAVNAVIASGSVTLQAKKSAVGKYELWITLDLQIKFVGRITDSVRLLILPF